MRILVVHNFYQDFGGEDVVFQQEVRALLNKKENIVDTLTFKNKKPWLGLSQFILSPWNITAAKHLKAKIREFQPDIIHIHNTQYACGPIVIRTAKSFGIPVVMSLHNFRLICPSATLFTHGGIYLKSITATFPWKAISDRVLDNSYIKTFWTAFNYWLHRKIGTWKMVDKYLVLSDFAKQMILNSTLPIAGSQLLVRPNFAPDIKYITPSKSDFFVYVGRLSEEKGILQLLDSLKGTNIKLKIFGDGPQRAEVDSYSSKYRNLMYEGFKSKEDINNELAKAKALIIPSVCYEGMPTALLEAYSLGRPVISSNLGVFNEIVKEGRTGFLFDPLKKSSVVAAVAKFEKLSTDELIQISQNCRNEYLTKYTERQNMQLLLDLYKKLIERSK